jgi:methyl-galactoside transport system permease protein
LQIGSNGGQTLSGLDGEYLEFVSGSLFKIGGVAVPKYVLYSLIITVIMWVVWNKTVFGRNMFAVGSNEEAARVSGINVFLTVILVFMLAGALYAVTGFIEGARIGSAASYTGLNYESDAIAACVIGGVSLDGGQGSAVGVLLGAITIAIIGKSLSMVGINAFWQQSLKGGIIMAAVVVNVLVQRAAERRALEGREI